ncbi:hypothetical protein GCM10009544_26240 [Streptomyces stramineus]|uniref:Uncharacterized protein n=1 Tax=Streptomyces stramineus TaxID=173861 RepID=A0ABP3JVI0_9ACTN
MTANPDGEALQPGAISEDRDPRLLPWEAPEGKPCFLSSADGQGVMSRYADSIEAAQMITGPRSWRTSRSCSPTPPRAAGASGPRFGKRPIR